MNDHERYMFDLQGYLVVPGALSPEKIAQLNSVLDEHIATECQRTCAPTGLRPCSTGPRTTAT